VKKTTNPYLLGVDIGTSSSKGVVTTLQGRIVAEHSSAHGVIYPRKNCVEQDPKQWWKSFGEITKALLRKSRINPRDIAALSVSGTYSDMCAVNRHGKPVRNAILYADLRATKETDLVAARVGRDRILEISGRALNPTMVLPRVLWYRKSEPEHFQVTSKILQCHSYVVYQLTNEFSVDYSTACSYGTFDMNALEWRRDVCDAFNLPIDLMPPAHQATDIVGEVTAEAAKVTHLRKGTPVTTGSGDSELAMVGAGVTKPGEAIITYGTSCVLNTVCEKPTLVPQFFTGIHCVEPLTYTIGNVLNTCGLLLKWFKDQFVQSGTNPEASPGRAVYSALDNAAAKIPPGSEGLIILPYLLGRYLGGDPRARGVIFGLTPSHTKEHVYRALLESIGYEIAEWLETLGKTVDKPKRVVATGGGARSRVWMQIVSDIADISQQLVRGDAPYGNAYLAGYSIGLIHDFDTISNEWLRDGRTIIPSAGANANYQRYFQTYKHLYSNLKEMFPELQG
jgi:xylulokinase